MYLEIENGLLLQTNFFSITLKPVEVDKSYLPSFKAYLELINYPESQAQLTYKGYLWFSFDNISNFVAEIQNIINECSESAQLKCMDDWTVITISKHARDFKVSIQIIANGSIAKTTITAFCWQDYDFINILAREITKFWRELRLLGAD